MLLTRTSHVSPATQSDFQSQTLGRQLEAGEPDPCSGRGSRSRAHGRPGATFGPHSPSSWFCRLLHPSPPMLEGRDCPCSDVNSEQGAWGRYEENSVGIGGGAWWTKGRRKRRERHQLCCPGLTAHTHTHACTYMCCSRAQAPAGGEAYLSAYPLIRASAGHTLGTEGEAGRGVLWIAPCPTLQHCPPLPPSDPHTLRTEGGSGGQWGPGPTGEGLAP